MKFNNPDTGLFTIPAYTKCYLVKPIGAYLETIRRHQAKEQVRWYAVRLDGLVRCVKKTDLMMEDEFNARRLRLKEEGVLPEDR